MGVALLALGAVAAQVQAQESAAYAACLQAANTTVSMNACNNAEIEREDKRLNQVYKQAMAALGPVQKVKLRDAQRLWIKYIDSNCDLYFTLTGGTMDMLNGAGCRLRMTSQRADELEALQLP
ncbi:DUF1311 domain-containing protein [Pseudomonas sp. MAFF212428]|uniref:DUF1311 domain-containing protein n=2 Tax=Pseudomonas brassicae TaxID=2708063 RepID=A0A6B3NX51_9PSED|nr:DUF1311 domain-containing protein [Pseudomonas brassicae]NER64858.1 DUF1311 domain-containing protein [Pseudomonas brassicae]